MPKRDLFKKSFIELLRYLPIINCTLWAAFCICVLFELNIVVCHVSIIACSLLLCLSIIFKYCTYHKVLILLALVFWILYEIRVLTYGILVLYLILYIILLLYGIRNKI